MLTLDRLGFLCVAILLLAMNLALSFFAFCFVVLVVWRFVAGLDADGVLIIPESVAVGAVVVYLVGLSVFVWRNHRSIRDEIMLAV